MTHTAPPPAPLCALCSRCCDIDKGGGVGGGLEVTGEFGEVATSDRDGGEGRGWVVIWW